MNFLFQPIVPAGGVVGWNFLQSTYDKQFDTFQQDPILERETDYFRENIGKVTSAEDLVKDRRLLNVALSAYSLDDQIDMKALVQKVLEEGSTADDALANRLGDDRWVQFTEAFGFGAGETVKTGDTQAMENLVYTYQVQSFEVAVEQEDASMRVALYAERELVNLAAEDSTVDTKWFTIMGSPKLREMMESVLGLPKEMGTADLDIQLNTFKDKAYSMFGTEDLTEIASEENMERLVHTYLARAQIAEFDAAYSSGATALTLLQG